MRSLRPRLSAALALAMLGPFFFLTYSFANWVTSQRGNVPSVVFGWERQIPFLPWTIVPYWSTDLFYAASLFLCLTRKELDLHVKRLLAVQVLCVVAFLMFPLRFSFEHRAVGGFLGSLFTLLGSFDKPFNQAPSLHVALTVILWARYSAHFRGWLWWTIRAWFLLMAASTLTTYRHHFIDVPAGIMAGLFCLLLVPEGVERQSRALSAAYFAGFSLLAAISWKIRGLAWLVLWPAGSMLIVAAIYFTGRTGWFRKRDGAIDPALRVVLAPYLALAWLNSRLWTHRDQAREIHPGIWLGRAPRRTERDALGIASMVDLSAELPVTTAGVVYRHVPVLDLVVPTAEQLDSAVYAIEGVRECRPTLVFCALGYSRSAMAVAAWLMARGYATSVSEAVALIRRRRAPIALSATHLNRLHEWKETTHV